MGCKAGCPSDYSRAAFLTKLKQCSAFQTLLTIQQTKSDNNRMTSTITTFAIMKILRGRFLINVSEGNVYYLFSFYKMQGSAYFILLKFVSFPGGFHPPDLPALHIAMHCKLLECIPSCDTKYYEGSRNYVLFISIS